MQTELSEQEVTERVALLRRFRELLAVQRDKFKNYLAVLEQQQTSIEAEDLEAMTAHSEMEEQIATELYSIQKVVDPLEMMYKEMYVGTSEHGIPVLKTDLTVLREKVQAQNKKNRELIEARMGDVKNRLRNITANPYARRTGNYYTKTTATAQLIDIRQ